MNTVSYKEEEWFKEIETKRQAEEERKTLWIIFSVLLGLFTVQCVLFGCRIWENFGKEQVQERTEGTLGAIKKVSVLREANFQLVCSEDSYATAIASVRPTVVSIKANAVNSVSRHAVGNYGATSGNGIYFDNVSDGSSGEKNRVGSGIIIDPKGYILTNYHVLAGAEEVAVTTFGFEEKIYPAQIVKTDAAFDLAILKIDSGEPFPAANLGNSDMIEVTDTVFAIGSPFGLEQTVTMGIISDDKRDLEIEGQKYENMIQTDAAINQGNSGGPLIDIKGEVIGINTAIYAPTGVFAGLGFAIPINKAKPLLRQIYTVR